MLEVIKRMKATYLLYNIFQKKKLQHNVRLYRKLGLRKSYFSPVFSKDFKHVDIALLTPHKHVEPLESTRLYKKLDEQSQTSLRNYSSEGFAILPQFLSNDTVDAVNAEIERLINDQKVSFRYRNKIMFAIHKSHLLKEIGTDPALLELLSSLMGDDVKLFQSINFLTGSEQRTHSDSIHMTTFPLGGLLGVWIALEDIGTDNGPLHYYPGSHVLPYYLNSDYDNEGNWLMIGNKDYKEYEQMLDRKIKEHHIPKQVFTAKKGDLLIWHANLLHGGEPHTNKQKTRKSMVYHYFASNSICYHEITQRPALISTN